MSEPTPLLLPGCPQDASCSSHVSFSLANPNDPNDSNDPNDPKDPFRRSAEESEIDGFAEDVSLNRRKHLPARVERIGGVGGNVDLRVEREELEHIVVVWTVGRRAWSAIDAVARGARLMAAICQI